MDQAATQTYQLTFESTILREEFPGHMEYVTLHARPITPQGVQSKAARTVFENIGDFVERFATLMPRPEAIELVELLESGVTMLAPAPVTHAQLEAIRFNFAELHKP